MLFLRTMKQESILEVWVVGVGGFVLDTVHPICAWSGEVGPKLAEGDRQAPEGFYAITGEGLNPESKYHRSLDLGFPNAYDRVHGRTGSLLMIHGGCESVGCYAIGDEAIEDLYQSVEAALADGQSAVPVHCLPFRMTEDNLLAHGDSPWSDFWRHELAPAYLWFETTRRLPRVAVREGRYVLT